MSGDPPERQCDFARELELSFPLIADPRHELARLYQAHRRWLGIDRRITYLIDPQGRIAIALHHELAITRHATEVLRYLERQR